MIKGDLSKAKELLQEGSYTCVLCRQQEVVTSVFRGVKPLVMFKGSGKIFEGFSAADKVVGRATAFLYVLLGVKEVYAGVISKPALKVLDAYGIKAEYGTLTENIINRKGDGICPFEKAVSDVEKAEEAFEIIKDKMIQMKEAER